MAAQVGGHINYDSLVKFDSPDGSTYWGLKNYNILVNFEIQMAALIGVLNIIIV